MTTPRQLMRQRVDAGATVWMAGAYDALSALLIDQCDFDGIFSTGFGVAAQAGDYVWQTTGAWDATSSSTCMIL